MHQRHLISAPLQWLRLRADGIGSAILPALLLVLVANPPQLDAQTPQQVLGDVRIDPRLGNAISLDAAFLDHTGAKVRLSEVLRGKPVVLCLVYFQCPMLCKLAADGLVRSLGSLPEEVGKDVDVWLVSFDPRDTPAAAAMARETSLRRYGRSAAAAGWQCLTGEQDAIDDLTEAVGFQYRWDPATQQYAHAAGLIVLTPEGRISGYLDGVNYSPRDLSNAITAAASGEVAAAAPTSFLRCYLYDPTTGRFGAAVQWTVRGLGLLTVLVMVVGITRMARRDRSSDAADHSPTV